MVFSHLGPSHRQLAQHPASSQPILLWKAPGALALIPYPIQDSNELLQSEVATGKSVYKPAKYASKISTHHTDPPIAPKDPNDRYISGEVRWTGMGRELQLIQKG